MRFRLFCLALIALAPAASARADLLVLQPGPVPGKDAQISNGSTAGLNFGNDPFLTINWFGNDRSIGLIEFDLSALPSGAVVTSATLSLYHRFNTNLGQRYDIFRVTSGWNESTVTFNTAPTASGVASSSLVIGDAGTDVYRNWNVTSLVQGWSGGAFSNFGMWIEEVPIQGAATAYFMSSDADPNMRPILTIEFQAVPAPAGVVLAGMGVVGAFGLRRRFRKLPTVA